MLVIYQPSNSPSSGGQSSEGTQPRKGHLSLEESSILDFAIDGRGECRSHGFQLQIAFKASSSAAEAGWTAVRPKLRS